MTFRGEEQEIRVVPPERVHGHPLVAAFVVRIANGEAYKELKRLIEEFGEDVKLVKSHLGSGKLWIADDTGKVITQEISEAIQNGTD